MNEIECKQVALVKDEQLILPKNSVTIEISKLHSVIENQLRHLPEKEIISRVNAAIVALTSEPRARDAKWDPAIEKKLRSEGRIQDDLNILEKLGFTGDLPKIPPALLEQCLAANGVAVLKFRTSSAEYAYCLNSALGLTEKFNYLKISNYSSYESSQIPVGDEKPEWICVPHTVIRDTTRLSKLEALAYVPNSVALDPIDYVLMLGYHHLKTGQQMPGFKDISTYTNQENIIVSSSWRYGIRVKAVNFDKIGNHYCGLAPGFDTQPKSPDIQEFLTQ